MRSVLTLILSFFVVSSFAQNGSTNTPDQTTGAATGAEATIADLWTSPLRLPSLQDIGGSPFFHDEYNPAKVQMVDGRIVSNVQVKFNVFNNLMMVQKDGAEMKLEAFDLISYDRQVEGVSKHFIFRQGYPEADGHANTAVYQVLAYGPKVHLVKYLSQKVEDAPTLGDYSRREIVSSQQLYVYAVGGELKKIKSSKQALTDALPAFSAQIEDIVKTKALNLKNESDIVILVNELNK